MEVKLDAAFAYFQRARLIGSMLAPPSRRNDNPPESMKTIRRNTSSNWIPEADVRRINLSKSIVGRTLSTLTNLFLRTFLLVMTKQIMILMIDLGMGPT